MNDYTLTVETVNGVEVEIYGGSKRPVLTYDLPGHVTGWRKRHGARTTYAELTCTCHLVGESHGAEGGLGSWISYGSEGWADRLNALALAHVENVTAHAYMIRPVRGDRGRVADRHRQDRAGLILTLAESGVAPDKIDAAVADVTAGEIVYGPDGTRFEIASDRAPYSRDPLPIY